MGWFAEGTSCGRIAANNGVIPMIDSLKIAAGKDYITPRPAARYTFMHLMHEVVPAGKSPQIAHRGRLRRQRSLQAANHLPPRRLRPGHGRRETR